MLGFCKHCRKIKFSIKNRPRKTAYAKEEKNWIKSCAKCQKIDNEHYAELWKECYSEWHNPRI